MDEQPIEASTSGDTPIDGEGSMDVDGIERNERTHALRKRNNTKKSMSQKSVHVTEKEIKLTSLPASTCRSVNQKTRQQSQKGKQSGEHTRHTHPSNDGFCIRSDNIFVYDRIQFKSLYKEPTSMCPSPENHVTKVLTLRQELSVACPTCWSIQRNS